MKRISDFVVGKFYTWDSITKPCECVYIGENEAVMKNETGHLVFAKIPELWYEVKEKITLTRYAAVVKVINDGEIKFQTGTYKTENDLRRIINDYSKYWELIEVIPVTWTGEK